jgi:hypothetical protein
MSNKIILFNLNAYIGGGETLLSRYAMYLEVNNIDYLIVCAKGSYIESSAQDNKLNFINWPLVEDSLIYKREAVANVQNFFIDNLPKDVVFNFFTFCMRDYVNVSLIFKDLNFNAKIFHGVYHNQDYKYLSSFSFNPKYYHVFFKDILRYLYSNKAVLFMNNHGFIESIGNSNSDLTPDFRPIPITLFDDDPISSEVPILTSDINKVLCISRFAAFKIGAVVAFLRLARKNPNLNFTLVGHGPFEFLITFLIKLWSLTNITLLTDVVPSQLKEIISQHHIGYAQGTSILEIAKLGKPVIIAPYSRLADIFNSKFTTYGIFGFVDGKFIFGDLVYKQGYPSMSLQNALNDIIFDYSNFKNGTLKTVKDYDSNEIFKLITSDILDGSLEVAEWPKISIKPPLLKQMIKSIIS